MIYEITAALIKTLDSVSVRNSGATLPYSSTARNDGPGIFRSSPAFRAVAPAEKIKTPNPVANSPVAVIIACNCFRGVSRGANQKPMEPGGSMSLAIVY
ncbi:MAG: hypothetical protein OXU98_00700, partial [Gammaproteobacteria bacterium]|nr:hypothetical protein [Gammaproteobacteria bacterium]